ncbi:MAG TPA: trypsin-like peptidase domain-containing protein [Acidimicrobiales bacterium]|jgi:S1-C subfamily serine protease|nr:trypsin-like peptidase domain-containing protein [Acidimicrobiales bacterium]
MEFDTEPEDVEQTEAIAPPELRPTFRKRLMLVSSALTLVVAAGLTGFFIGHANENTTKTVAKAGTTPPQFPTGGFGGYGNNGGYPNPPATPAGNTPAPKVNSAAGKIAASVDPGLVDITTQLSLGQGTAAGTGMIVSKSGYILTNNHVIAGATSISVRDVATGKTYKASVVGYDVTSDIAVLKLKNASGLTTIKTNTSTPVKGESVVGIGNAGGTGGTPSYAAGSVLAVDQSITAADDVNPTGSETLSGMIEINAPIQPGDSGGALVNSKGQVIGMDTAASVSGNPVFSSASATTTQAFAIPIGTALSIAKSIENGSSSSTVHVGGTAFLGIEVDPTSTSPFPGFGNGAPSTTSGVTIAQTVPGTPAASSALTSGDVIVSVNGQAVTTITSLDEILQTLKPGDTVSVGYTNASGASATLQLVLGSGPPQ